MIARALGGGHISYDSTPGDEIRRHESCVASLAAESQSKSLIAQSVLVHRLVGLDPQPVSLVAAASPTRRSVPNAHRLTWAPGMGVLIVIKSPHMHPYAACRQPPHSSPSVCERLRRRLTPDPVHRPARTRFPELPPARHQ